MAAAAAAAGQNKWSRKLLLGYGRAVRALVDDVMMELS